MTLSGVRSRYSFPLLQRVGTTAVHNASQGVCRNVLVAELPQHRVQVLAFLPPGTEVASELLELLSGDVHPS